MRDLIARLASMAGTRVRSYGGCDLSGLIAASIQPVHPLVAEYFDRCIPNVPIDLFDYRLTGRKEVRHENEVLTPSYYSYPQGFITFGSTPCGDAVAVDCRDAAVYVLSHGRYSDEGIFQGWNDDCTAFLPNLPINRANVVATAEERFLDLTTFFAHWERIARDTIEKHARFELEAQANPNVKDDLGNTPLINAIHAEDEAQVESLIARGANVNLEDGGGETPLFHACSSGRPASLARRLLELGADVNYRNHQKQTPLMWAVHSSNYECIRLLLDAGADVAASDGIGRTALDRICPVHGTPQIKRLLRRAMKKAGDA